VTRSVAEAVLRERDFDRSMARAFHDGWRQRSEVDALLSVPRSEVEARWISV